MNCWERCLYGRRICVASTLEIHAVMIDPPSHKPTGYRCPFCAIAGGAESEFTAWRDEHVLVQIALHWSPANPGKALVIPLAHIENIYTLPDELAGRIAHMVRRVAGRHPHRVSLRRRDGAAEQRAGRAAKTSGICTRT